MYSEPMASQAFDDDAFGESTDAASNGPQPSLVEEATAARCLPGARHDIQVRVMLSLADHLSCLAVERPNERTRTNKRERTNANERTTAIELEHRLNP